MKRPLLIVFAPSAGRSVLLRRVLEAEDLRGLAPPGAHDPEVTAAFTGEVRLLASRQDGAQAGDFTRRA